MPKWLVVDRGKASLIRSVHLVPEHDTFGHHYLNCDCGVVFTIEPMPSGFVSFVYTHEAWDGRP